MATSASRRATARAAGRLLLGLFPALLALAALGGAALSAAAVPLFDEAPAVLSAVPPPGARGVPPAAAQDGTLSLTFTEPVTLTDAALELVCERTQAHALAVADGDTTFTFISDRPFLPGEVCVATLRAAAVADLDADDPPDQPAADFTWSFRTAAEPVILNELDAIAPDGTAEFVELFDGGRGDTDLSGMTLVLYRGDEASVYLAVGLDGYRTDGAGYFVLGASGVAGVDLRLADGTLRDGPDAVALYTAPETEFPRNAPVSTEDLLDAAVYGPAGPALLALLLPGQDALDEDSRGAAGSDSNQRCPNGGGRPRATEAFIRNDPTPGRSNACRIDAPPLVVDLSPANGATAVALDAVLEIVFSEPVTIQDGLLDIECTRSGGHAYTVAGHGDTFRFQPETPFIGGEVCGAAIDPDRVSDADADDPPDHLPNVPAWSFEVITPVADDVRINEIDADTPGVDAAEFIELYDGGAGNTPLDGLAVVLFNGSDDRSYLAVDLDGWATDGSGYFLLADAAVAGAGIVLANGALQNGPDAVALVAGDAAGFPNGTPVTATVPLDAIVYGRPAEYDSGLLPLLNPGQPQVDENGRGAADSHSNQRCPNGGGGDRNTAGYKQNTPTPGAANDCITDAAPAITGMTPGRGATGVGIDATIGVTFDEPVTARGKWVTIRCETSGNHTYRTSGGPTSFTVEPTAPFAHTELCTITTNAGLVTDRDADDPPDMMARNVSWSFTTAAAPADFVLINEIDTDTPSTDAAEFIELYDGGVGNTSLNGLALVLYNGSNHLSYRAIDLDGLRTDARGYFVVGNAAVSPGLIFTDGALQNGPDAVALYAADATQFPTDSPIRLQGLIDAIVYGRAADVPPELLDLLAAGQAAVDENGRGAGDAHSLQRCPNGAGGSRHTANFLPNRPTPGTVSACITDDPPAVSVTVPAQGAAGVSVYSRPAVTFNEPVAMAGGAVLLTCSSGGDRQVNVSGGPVTFQIEPLQPLPYSERCSVRLVAANIADTDADDPPDHPAADFEWSFTTAAPPADFVLINEIDADTPGVDTAEFIELFDGGIGHTDLTGLVVVLYNGSDDRSYLAIELTGLETNAAGYLVIGNSGVPGSSVNLPAGTLQNGADAAALYAGDSGGFPNGTVIHTRGLLDAVVYGTADPADPGLLALLATGEGQIDEAGRGAADLHSSGRCPNGAGGQRHTAAYRPNTPTPGAPNSCTVDEPPTVVGVDPPDGAVDVAQNARLRVTFNEDVVITSGWYSIACEIGGAHAAAVSGGPREFTLTPDTPFPPGESCEVALHAALIADTDADDPPDHPAADFEWSFTTAAPPIATGMLINEIDADTPGSDTAEFIELYDGGVGHTNLAGLVIVFWNGADDTAYRAIDLTGQQTDEGGYFVLGNAGLAGASLTFANGALQNGPDAVGLYAGRSGDYPAGRPLTTAGLIDALVYGSSTSVDQGLLGLLDPGQPQVDEAGRGAGDVHSIQRCPNGAGGPRRTAADRPNPPTLGAPNNCTVDDPPSIVTVSPPDGSEGAAPDTALMVRFSEDVAIGAGWNEVVCATSGSHASAVTGGPREFTLTPAKAFAPGELCTTTLRAALISDTDADDPPDHPAADFEWAFTTAAQPVSTGMLINEIDADTSGSDTAEFIELYDGGVGHTNLAGLVVVFWNGKDDQAYRAIDLSGQETNGAGYFVLGNAGVPGVGLVYPDGGLQNGPDAVGLYAGRAADFPAGASLSTTGLFDAVVYGPEDDPDAGLLPLLEAGELQRDEGGRGEKDTHSLQRCPDGAGGARRTAAYRPDAPTPGAPNLCTTDEPPAIRDVSPPNGSEHVDPDGPILIRFSEDVAPIGEWFAIRCAVSGDHPAETSGGPREFTLTPDDPFALNERCDVMVRGALVYDRDTDDPPDAMAADFAWHFVTAAPAPATVLINEVDADTPGSDTAEFIELFDGGAGHTDLTGLVLVFWNGKDDRSYRAVGLDDYETDAAGYFTVGNAGLAPDLTIGRGGLQNGPDAAALYVGRAADFPSGTRLRTAGLIDAVVYGAAGAPDEALLALLEAGQPQVDEGGRGDGETHSLQRCPNGEGGPRRTAAYRPDAPTPGGPNRCAADDPPVVTSISPAGGATGVAVNSPVVVGFSEDVVVEAGWYTLNCEKSGEHPAAASGGPSLFVLAPESPFAADEGCAVTLHSAAVRDADSDDPPDLMAGDYTWSFRTAPAAPPPVAGFLSNGPLWIGETAVFTNTSAGPGPLSFVWDFGDGSPPAVETHPAHPYATVGTYLVTLTAGGPTGTAAYSATIEVRPRAVWLAVVAGTGQ